jgi:CRP/FNR family transcriptional regulator, cyclic AMP receptor protein
VDFSRFFNYENVSEGISNEAFQFLSHWSKAEWEQILALCTVVPFKAGQVVIRQGETRQSFFVVAAGELEVLSTDVRGKVHHLALIPKGAVFGEQSFIEGTPRSAEVRARTDGEVMELTLTQFEVLAAQQPKLARDVLWDLARILSARLRATTSAFVKLKR